MSDASITVAGNVASDVHATVMKNGEWVTSFRLACQRRYYDRRSRRWMDEPPSFYRVVCWRGLAKNVKDCVSKGEPIVVHGRVRLRDWTDDQGNRRTDAEIDAWSVSYDLMRGTAVFSRSRPSPEQVDENATLDRIRSEQRARVGDEVIVDPETGEMFRTGELRGREATAAQASGRQDAGAAQADAAPTPGAGAVDTAPTRSAAGARDKAGAADAAGTSRSARPPRAVSGRASRLVA